MLTQEIKRKIDNARQILVGKVPDPKAQVEQITNALIYKFMDDMDRESEELGGKARFFTNEFGKYSWGKLMDTRISGRERLDMYVEAITKMSRNPHLPQLFRDIFKDAFLPYRDPETLNLFLKEINGFTYDHSENLGDAFEYLLSVMAAQGDAGQFRTPRHIIDFIVEVVSPKKDETILDPACGTAGFLISAYKHILRENEKRPLSPDAKKRLMNNLVGYDISPDMVKLSLVNMYLHSFREPKIFEYDTLSSEDKWDEMYDVIMTNPPFMTPKGGIRPHKRFSVQANRSEVLFVDYILEHLNQKGRAGIIVPEGIIFQTANAYKELRRLLIEDGLFAVASLPAGVFNPYSGVKTSILFFDKQLTKEAKDILFVKITNDGYDLGAQRRKLDNDGELPIVIQVLKTYIDGLRKGIGKKFKIDKSLDYLAWLTPKERIIEREDYNLSGERYKATESYKKQKWPMVDLDKIINLDFGKRITKSKNEGTKFPVYGGGGESFRTDEFNRENEYVISRFAMSENCVRFVSGKFFLLDSGFSFSIKDEYKNKVDKKFLGYLFLRLQDRIYALARGHAQKNLDVKKFRLLKIPFPPLEVQKEIVGRIEKKQAVINNAKELISKIQRERANSGRIFERLDCGRIELGRVLNYEQPTKYIVESVNYNNEYKTPVLTAGKTFILGYTNEKQGVFKEKLPVIIFDDFTTASKFVDFPFKVKSSAMKILHADKKKADIKYLYYLMQNIEFPTNEHKRYWISEYSKIKIPLPSLGVQKEIAEFFNKQSEAIQANQRLIEIFEEQIKNEVDEAWRK